jgi:ABC-2 type transport system permease protein
MTASAGAAPSGATRTRTSAFSRIYGFGSIYAKTIRDSRLAFIIVAGLIGSFLVSGAAAFGQAYSTLASREDLARLVASLPPVMAGIYGDPFPQNITTLGGSLAWKTGGSLGLMAGLWSILALSGTLATEARRGSLDFVAVTPLGARRIALEKLAAHVTGMAFVTIVTILAAYLGGLAFKSLPGDEIPIGAAGGFGLWVGLVGLASGSVAWALSSFVGRAASAGIAGAILVVGYFVNGYQASAPVFAGFANLTWFGWTAHHSPLAGAYDWMSLIPVALVAIVLFAVGVEAFARRDLGATSHVPSPSFPEVTLGLGGPIGRSLGDRLPIAIAWGIGVGLYAFVLGGAAKSFGTEIDKLSPSTLQIFKSIFPNINLHEPGAFLQLTFVTFGFILAGFAAATIVSGWASDEGSGRLELLLTTPLARARWAIASGVGVMLAIGVLTLILALAVLAGVIVGGGGDVATPFLGAGVLGLYAAALAGIGLAVGGLFRSSIAGETVAGLVILGFLLDLIPPALGWPDWLHQLALTAHLGQPMAGTWDWVGIGACVAIAIGGILVSAWGIARRDVAR